MYLIDTHVLLWMLFKKEKLSDRVIELINDSDYLVCSLLCNNCFIHKFLYFFSSFISHVLFELKYKRKELMIIDCLRLVSFA